MAERMYRTRGSLNPVTTSNEGNPSERKNSANLGSFEEQMARVLSQHEVKIKTFATLCDEEESADTESKEKQEESHYAVLNKGVTHPVKANVVVQETHIAMKHQQEEEAKEDLDVNQDNDNNVNGKNNEEGEQDQVSLNDMLLSQEAVVKKGGDVSGLEYAEIQEEGQKEQEDYKEEENEAGNSAASAEASSGETADQPSPIFQRQYKILRVDDDGNERLVMIHVSAGEGISDEQGKIIALDAAKQKEIEQTMRSEEMIAVTQLDNSITEHSQKKKSSTLEKMKKTFSPKKTKRNVTTAAVVGTGAAMALASDKQKDTTEAGRKTPKSPSTQFFKSIFKNTEMAKAADKKRKPSTGEFISARLHTAYYEEDDIYTWAYDGYEKRIEIRENRDKTSVPYITVQRPEEGGRIFTADRIGKCIRTYTPEGTYTHTATCVSVPLGIEMYESDKVICAYPHDNSIAMLDMNKMVQVQTIRSRSLKMPRGIAANPTHRGAVAVSDIKDLHESTIKIFDLKSGKLAQTIARNNSAMIHKLGWVEFMTFADNDLNLLFIADSWKHRIYAFDLRNPDTSILEFGEQGSDGGQMSNPCGLAFMPEGKLYPKGSVLVADWYNDRVPAYDPTTGELQHYLLNERIGSPTPVTNPYDIAVNDQGTIFVSESSTNYVKVFEKQDKLPVETTY